jgi:glycosyltransferase involved in cell wall biosynthesis
MIGQGMLRGACMDLAMALNIEDGVTFLGALPPTVVRQEMRQARCFVQHSVTAASNGDSEGTPVGILEAGASGLPAVSTRHAGIPDVVIEGETGLLVEEHDVGAMASGMLRIAQDAEFAGQLGRSAGDRIRTQFSMEQSISNLWSIIESCIETH